MITDVTVAWPDRKASLSVVIWGGADEGVTFEGVACCLGVPTAESVVVDATCEGTVCAGAFCVSTA